MAAVYTWGNPVQGAVSRQSGNNALTALGFASNFVFATMSDGTQPITLRWIVTVAVTGSPIVDLYGCAVFMGRGIG